MNSLVLSGRVIGAPEFRNGQTGTPKTLFEITADGGPEGPLYFNCVAFGQPASAAARLKEGDKIFLAGKLATSRYGQAMSVILSTFELLERKGTDND